MALTFPLSLMQSAALVGLFGLSLIAGLVLAAPGYILALSPAAVGSARRRAVLALGLPLAGLVSMLTFGTLRLSAPPPPPLEGVRVRLVQPSIDQREKWLAAKQPEFVARHLALSLQNARGEPDGLAGITHVVWPEAAMPFLPLQRPEVLRAIDEALPDHVHLLAGILRLERSGVPVTGEERYARDGDRIYNSLAVFNGEGKPIGVYDKTHLVPFGEYLPFQSLLEGIGLSSLTRQRGGFALGLDPRPLLATPGLAGIGPLICYEAVFPGITAKSAGRPQVMINVTNDGWFGNSTGPRQHLHQSRLRSVEEGIPLMRVANNGITAVYDAYGRELARLDLDVAGVIDTEVPGRLARPLYAVLGDLIFGAMILLTVVILKGGRISFTKPKVDNTPTWRKLLT
jgi:apolipoprotein N-acyltransferase